MQRENPIEDMVKVMLEETTKGYLQIRSSLQEPLKSKLINFLMQSLDVFAWSPSDILGLVPLRCVGDQS